MPGLQFGNSWSIRAEFEIRLRLLELPNCKPGTVQTSILPFAQGSAVLLGYALIPTRHIRIWTKNCPPAHFVSSPKVRYRTLMTILSMSDN